MGETMNYNLEARIVVLEKRNRLLSVGVAVLAIVALGVVLTGAASGPADEIVARRLSIVGADGEARAEIVVIDGSGGIVFRDASGNRRAVLHARSDMPSLGLYDSSGENPVALLGVSGNLPRLLLTDSEGNLRAKISVDDDTAGFGVYDSVGNKQVWAGTGTMGSNLVLSDNKGRGRIVSGFVGGNPGLVVYDENGEPVAGVVED